MKDLKNKISKNHKLTVISISTLFYYFSFFFSIFKLRDTKDSLGNALSKRILSIFKTNLSIKS
jgi:hypothetical protein